MLTSFFFLMSNTQDIIKCYKETYIRRDPLPNAPLRLVSGTHKKALLICFVEYLNPKLCPFEKMYYISVALPHIATYIKVFSYVG